MGVAEKLPCSVLSIFHGISVVLVLCFLAGTWVALWQINYNERYAGNHNDCFAGDTIGTYGDDNAMYCPNTKIVSSVNISLLGRPYIASLYKQPASSIPLDGSRNFTFSNSVYFDDDDDGTYWWFNINPGSYVEATFSNIPEGADLVVRVDDDDVYDIPVGNDGHFTMSPDPVKEYGLPSRGYKFTVISSNKDAIPGDYCGDVNFYYNETLYGSQVSPVLNGSTTCSGFGLFCFWEFNFGEDVCINFYDNTPTRRNYANADPNCVQIIQTGWDSGWNAFLIPLSCLLVIVIICCNILVSLMVSRAQRSKELPIYKSGLQ